MEESTRIEFDSEVQRLSSFALFHGSNTITIVAVAFDIHDAVEIGVHNGHCHLDTVGQTVDNDVRSREANWWWWWRWYRSCKIGAGFFQSFLFFTRIYLTALQYFKDSC